MFKRFNMWLRAKLGVSALKNELLFAQSEISKANQKLRKLSSENEAITRENNELRRKIIHSTSQYNALMEQFVDVGIDVNEPRYNEPSSWAVICLAGKPHYLKFYVLGHDHMQDIHNFLKPYDRANRVVDAADHIRRFLL